MDLPDFKDFMRTLDPQTISAIFHDANTQAKAVVEMGEISADSTPGLQIQSIGFTIALELLAAYHRWLEQQP